MAEVKEETKKKTTTKKKTNTTTKKKTNTETKKAETNTTTKKPRKKTTKKEVNPSEVITPIESEEVIMQEETKPVEIEEEIKVTEDLPEINNFDPKEVKETDIDTPEERDDLAMAINASVSKDVKNITNEVKENEKISNKDKVIDLGIIIVVIGLFVLVLTTYLNNIIELSYQETNILVIIALAIETLGVAIMLIGTFKKN